MKTACKSDAWSCRYKLFKSVATAGRQWWPAGILTFLSHSQTDEQSRLPPFFRLFRFFIIYFHPPFFWLKFFIVCFSSCIEKIQHSKTRSLFFLLNYNCQPKIWTSVNVVLLCTYISTKNIEKMSKQVEKINNIKHDISQNIWNHCHSK